MIATKPKNVTYKICSVCKEKKTSDMFYTTRVTCCECINSKRREKYKNDEEHRKKIIKQVSEFKHEKVIIKQQIKQEEQNKMGLENKKCKYCNEIKQKDRFRYNRLKCRDCERDDPTEKFKRYIRTRIYNCLRNKNKTKHSIEYLGCSSLEYFKWIFHYNNECLLENHGKKWHVDHVIPISKFDLNNQQEHLLAFNWRNTMPLSCKENLSKNNKIIIKQISDHYIKLKEYHIENKLDLPQVFIDLFAKHLDAGKPLEPSLPLTFGNICEELG
jgi:ethanolamine utilization protein EutQ (cupin superfamily)